ncbi:hypothetical protein RRG08_025693 [Elysia crispata]|uniref:Uncharacterized protein n=1 Tax=Elysia crispata TaxID=231223 RepID=A0AAE1AZC9_9GAST|nr:hypothetical protein RRG08_025693 [Elysia crispata]
MVGVWVPSHQTSWLDLGATGVTLGERYGRWVGALTPDQLARSSSYRRGSDPVLREGMKQDVNNTTHETSGRLYCPAWGPISPGPDGRHASPAAR